MQINALQFEYTTNYKRILSKRQVRTARFECAALKVLLWVGVFYSTCRIWALCILLCWSDKHMCYCKTISHSITNYSVLFVIMMTKGISIQTNSQDTNQNECGANNARAFLRAHERSMNDTHIFVVCVYHNTHYHLLCMPSRTHIPELYITHGVRWCTRSRSGFCVCACVCVWVSHVCECVNVLANNCFVKFPAMYFKEHTHAHGTINNLKYNTNPRMYC